MPHMNHKEAYPEHYLQDILKSVRTIAMVGASPDPESRSSASPTPRL